MSWGASKLSMLNNVCYSTSIRKCIWHAKHFKTATWPESQSKLASPAIQDQNATKTPINYHKILWNWVNFTSVFYIISPKPRVCKTTYVKPVHAESPWRSSFSFQHNIWFFTAQTNTNTTANAPKKKTILAQNKTSEKEAMRPEKYRAFALSP